MRRIEYRRTTWHRRYKRALGGCLAVLAALMMAFPAFASGDPSKSGLTGEDLTEQQPRQRMLIPGGTPFGVRVYTRGVLVFRVEPGSTAEKCGILAGDLITELDGKAVCGAIDFSKRIAEIESETMVLTVERGKERLKISAHKNECTGQVDCRAAGLGVYVRDTLAGIGTLTYFDPQTGAFAGLGHGICDGASGTLVPIVEGTIADVRITSVNKGFPGAPGQLRGIFCPGVKGSVLYNKEEGLFGIFQKQMPYAGDPCPVADKGQIREGKAEILCTVSGPGPEKYDVQIERIYGYDRHTKNFLIKVTDKRLLEEAGGIVQGMSGSPILQDGRIIGAVTHVLVDDPTSGYGIYIGNMLDAAK